MFSVDSSVLLYAPTIFGYNHLIIIDINRASGYSFNNPILAPQATMWGPKSAQENINRGAVADPAKTSR